MRTLRRSEASTGPLQFPTPIELLDANSTATVTRFGSASGVEYFWNRGTPPTDMVFTMVVASQPKETELEESAVLNVATANRELIIEEPIHVAETSAPGIFVAARPVRKKLFEMQFTFPQGGLPKRKPFVWVPKAVSEE